MRGEVGVKGERWKEQEKKKWEEMEMVDGWWECFYKLAFNKTLQYDVIVREQLHLYCASLCYSSNSTADCSDLL